MWTPRWIKDHMAQGFQNLIEDVTMLNKIILCWMTVLILPLPCLATVNIVVCTNDGLVVAADSRVILQYGTKTRIASEFAQKVKQIGSHLAVTYSGAAHLYDLEENRRSIGSIIDEYKNDSGISEETHADPRLTVEALDSLFTTLYTKKRSLNVGQGTLKMMICGYDTNNIRRYYDLQFVKQKSEKSQKFSVVRVFDSSFASGVTGASPGGQTDVWTRLIKGYSPTLKSYTWFREFEVEVPDSLDSTVVDTVVKRDTLNVNDLRYDIRYDLMTLQDAIDFAVFIVRATIEAQRFNQSSIQGVGGAIDIAVITPDGFRWIQHKQLHGEGSPELIEY